jgi:hypothetical protein
VPYAPQNPKGVEAEDVSEHTTPIKNPTQQPTAFKPAEHTEHAERAFPEHASGPLEHGMEALLAGDEPEVNPKPSDDELLTGEYTKQVAGTVNGMVQVLNKIYEQAKADGAVSLEAYRLLFLFFLEGLLSPALPSF